MQVEFLFVHAFVTRKRDKTKPLRIRVTFNTKRTTIGQMTGFQICMKILRFPSL